MKKNVAILLVGTALVVGLAGSALRAAAQTQTTWVLMNWRADSYVPDGYQGKVLPASNSRIVISLDLFDKGARVDLSKQKVYWYVDNRFVQGGQGLVHLTTDAPRIIGGTAIAVRAFLPDYPGGPARTVTIPVAPPDIVIQTSSANLAATPFTLQAYPYFFNIKSASQLQYTWILGNEVVGSQNPFVITSQMAQGKTNASLELRVANPTEPIERLSRSLIVFPRQ